MMETQTEGNKWFGAEKQSNYWICSAGLLLLLLLLLFLLLLIKNVVKQSLLRPGKASTIPEG